MRKSMALSLFLCYCAYCCTSLHAQDCWSEAASQMAGADYGTAITHLAQCAAQAHQIGDDTDWASANVYIAYCHYRLGQLDSLRHYTSLLNARLPQLHLEDKPDIEVYHQGVRADVLYIIGLSYYTIGWYREAVGYYEYALSQLLDRTGKTADGQPNYLHLKNFFSFEGSDLLNNLAAANYELGNYERALELYRISGKTETDSWTAAYGTDYKNKPAAKKALALRKSNLGMTLLEIGQPQPALAHTLAGMELLHGLESEATWDTWALLHRNLGYYHLLESRADSCIIHIQKGLQYAKGGEAQIKLYQIYAEAAPSSEWPWIQDSLQALVERHYGRFHPYMAKNYTLLGDFSAKKGAAKQADLYYNQAINTLRNQKGSNCACHDVSDADLADFYDPYSLLEILEKKSGLLHNSGKGDEALNCYQLLGRLVLEMQQKYLDDVASEYLLSRKARKIYEKAIAIALKLGREEEAHAFCQQGKRIVMRQQMQEGEKFRGIPENIATKGKNLHTLLLEATHHYEIAKFAKDKDATEHWRAVRFSRNQDYVEWLASLEGILHGYDAPTSGYPALSKRELCRRVAGMGEDAVLVEYFLGEERLFRFKADGRGLSASSLPLTPDFHQALDTFILHTQTYHPDDAAFGRFHTAAHELHRWLLGSLLPDTSPSIPPPRLIIIPDGKLQKVSFAALLTQPYASPDSSAHYEKLDYLVGHHDISYLYASHLLSQPTLLRQPRFLGIAPSFASGQHTSLGHTVAEVENAAEWYHTPQLLLGKQARKARVMPLLAHYDVIHFATHAYPNEQVPFDTRIILADTSLFLHELLANHWRPSLVVLSACHSSAGGQIQGEGILSLASACIQTGSAAVLSSLWQAEDSDAKYLSQNFHEKLAQPQPKDHALAFAQRTHLADQVSWKTHPYYWSGFILTGNPQPIHSSVRPSPWWLYALPALAVLAAWLAWRWRNQSPDR